MALNYREVAGFKALIKAILEEVEDPDNFDGLWSNATVFDNSFNHDEYPISAPKDNKGNIYDIEGTEGYTEETGGVPDPWIYDDIPA